MKKLFGRLFQFLCKQGVIEPMFDEQYPTLDKAWVAEIRKLADGHVNQRFLTCEKLSVFPRYKIHPIKGVVLLFQYLRQTAIRST